jgi:hypothetical protein
VQQHPSSLVDLSVWDCRVKNADSRMLPWFHARGDGTVNMARVVVGIGAIWIVIPAYYNMSAVSVKDKQELVDDQTLEKGLTSDDLYLLKLLLTSWCCCLKNFLFWVKFEYYGLA